MTNKQEQLLSLVMLAFGKEAIKKLVFSRPQSSEISKVSARLCAHRGKRLLALEYSLPGNTVCQKNLGEDTFPEEFSRLADEYRQINLISALGDAEWKLSSSGKEALLGADKLSKKLSGESPDFEKAIEALDNKKNHLLSGSEDFLIKLGISDKSGRVHDKKQGKFRQINRFIEHIEAVYGELPDEGDLLIYDLCCGKSYLSFAVYYYLTAVKGRRVNMLGIDLKRDVIEWCAGLAAELRYAGLRFITDDVTNTPKDRSPDMVISLHACDVATDIVLDTATALGARVILSTPCCHRYLNGKIKARELSFVTQFPHLSNKICEALTDSLRLLRLRAAGYSVKALELTDPDDTPKNTLLRAVRSKTSSDRLTEYKNEYEATLKFILGDNYTEYLKDI